MIVVKSIELMTVSEDFFVIRHIEDEKIYKNRGHKLSEREATQEMVQGRRFINSHGEEFCIGMANDVQEAIGLPFEAYDNLREALDSCQAQRNKLEEKINQATFWERLKYLFTRKI